MQEATLEAIEADISAQLSAARPRALDAASEILDRGVSVHSLHGIVGGKNNFFADSVNTEFASFDEFLAVWMRGLRREAEKRRERGDAYWPDSGSWRLVRLLKNPALLEYTELFLERNFYRNYVERTRYKPSGETWSLWFGANQMVWGLVIAPAFRRGQWTNDVSEIRRAKYAYWTVGHVLKTGLIDPAADAPYRFASLRQFLDFYRSVLKRISNSLYEQRIADAYVDYVTAEPDPESVPFLIPELRYAGLGQKHVYRLDYSVLNVHTRDFVGFELSPQSTHMKVAGKEKSLKEHNVELLEKWEHEMAKRNEYFDRFGLSVKTFTDGQLRDMDACFGAIAQVLSARPPERQSAEVERRKVLDL
ncbi:MAG: topoisomerase II [Planctomycetota bacterium]